MGSQLCCVDGIAGTFGSGWSLLLKVGSALAHLTAQAEELYKLSRASAARGDSNTIHALMVGLSYQTQMILPCLVAAPDELVGVPAWSCSGLASMSTAEAFRFSNEFPSLRWRWVCALEAIS